MTEGGVYVCMWGRGGEGSRVKQLSSRSKSHTTCTHTCFNFYLMTFGKVRPKGLI